MRKTKKKIISDSVKQVKNSSAIEERLAACGRGEAEHIEYIGELVEKVLKGEFGAILKALTAGRLSIELDSSKTSNKSSDWHLGRASMANDLWHDFEAFVLDADKLKEPKEVVETDEQSSPE